MVDHARGPDECRGDDEAWIEAWKEHCRQQWDRMQILKSASESREYVTAERCGSIIDFLRRA